MRKITVCLLFFALLFHAWGQDANRFFPEDRLLIPGAFYYPEHWPEHQWERDFEKMAEMGFEFVHMAEFAWAFLEPSEGVYDFDWLDRAIDLAAKNGLKVMLCTPTATIPVWMGIKYPDTYLMNNQYRRAEHGSRQNNSLVSGKYIELSEKIIREMAKRYGDHPHVWGWQLDNEPYAKDDYSPAAQEAFRQWLKNKYQTIEALNHAWGTAFWSITYSSFDEVRIHNTGAIDWWGNNPHAVLDFRRFTAWVQANDLDRQALILREYINPDQFITTNYVAVPGNADPRLTENLDFISYTSYPNNGTPNLGEYGFRLGNHTALMLANDYFRPINGVTGVLEIQPGQVNWASSNPMLMPGTVHMWLYHSFGAGSRLASSYRFRQKIYGVEQYHDGMLRTDGVTPSQGGEEYITFIEELKMLEGMDVDTEMPEDYAAKTTAILWSHDNMWDHNRQPQNDRWNIWNHTLKYHQILKSIDAPVDYVSESCDWSRYPTLIVPAYQSVDSVLVEKLTNYAKRGGTLVVTCRTAKKNRFGHFWEAGWSAPIYDLIGAEIEGYDMLPGYKHATVEMNGKEFKWNRWGELLKPFKDEYAVAKYSDQFYAGKSAVVQREIGQGTVTYIGVDTETGELEKQLIKGLFKNRGLPVSNLPEGVFSYWRDGFRVAVNYSSEVYEMPLPENAKIVIGEKKLPSPGVLVWIE
ncbi:beta-galactosidase [Alkalitalea saponilacus]|uniref:Beta-galactosidase n=1 Tax=Alkalitalea saponilacus TaxID=889453 RepID=A0A1T5B9G1_9BACT|nr:beta-galactosidase [Alkalitalea saponilacus]ASB49753.1 beta-galactosidase [Alkalitalea saponilacus]SKB43600.1 beta-galactosidase [Alkalitalea saponilacus]